MEASRKNAKPTLLRRVLACLVSAAMVVAFTPVVAWGGTVADVKYLDAGGVEQTCTSATVVTSEDKTWGDDGSDGWYVVSENTTISGSVTITSSVNLILDKDCTLNVTDGIAGAGGSGSNLTIYGQPGGVGELHVAGSIAGGSGVHGMGSKYAAGGGSVTINGGTVTATGGIAGGRGGDNQGDDIYGGGGGSVTINGGTVTATGGIAGGRGGDVAIESPATGGGGGSVTINGGTVTATGGIAGGSSGNGDTAGTGGCITIRGGTVTSAGTITAGNGGGDGGRGINILGGTLVNGGTIAIASGMYLNNDGIIISTGSIQNSGRIINDGSIYVDGELSNSDGSTLENWNAIYYPLALDGATATENTSSKPGDTTKTYGKAGGEITLTPVAPAGYSFGTWNVISGSITIGEGNKFTMPSAAVSVAAQFTPNTNTLYTVEHWFQNVDNNDYTLDGGKTESKTGTTDQLTNATAATVDGFTAKAFQQQTIAGDESTAVKIYYDRKVCKVTFVDEDGTTVLGENTYKYGTSAANVAKPSDPAKAATPEYSYEFVGWSPSVGDVDSDVTYKAIYSETKNKYDVTFDANGHGTAPSAVTGVEYGTTVNAPDPPEAEGYTFGGWFTDASCTAEWIFNTSTVKGATTLYAKWTVNQYKITFDTGGGTAIDPITQDYGTAVTKPADPTRSGYSFGGWYSDQALTQAYVFGTMPAEDTTLYAKWNYIPDPVPPAPEVGETVEGVSIGGGSVEASVTVTGGATTDSQGNKVDGSVSIGGIAAGEGAVTIPETVTVNGKTYLVTEVEPGALAGNTVVESVTLPANVTVIGAGAFEGCTSLATINVPAGVTKIEADTFAGCTGLKSVELQGEVTEVGASAFSGCTSLEAIDLPATVRAVGEGAFEGCSSLASVKLPAGAVIGARAFAGSGITKLTVPANAVIRERAFQGCAKLKSVTVSKGVEALPAYAFKGCAKLAKVTLPSGVTKIERSAFSGCKSLRSIVLPKSVVAIGKNALYGASKVKKLTIESKQLTKKGVAGCLKGSSVTTVYVPKSKLDAYSKLFTRSVCGKKVTLKPIK